MPTYLKVDQIDAMRANGLLQSAAFSMGRSSRGDETEERIIMKWTVLFLLCGISTAHAETNYAFILNSFPSCKGKPVFSPYKLECRNIEIR
jgi:hypothetical protein